MNKSVLSIKYRSYLKLRNIWYVCSYILCTKIEITKNLCVFQFSDSLFCDQQTHFIQERPVHTRYRKKVKNCQYFLALP
jgi:hypothetical protein